MTAQCYQKLEKPSLVVPRQRLRHTARASRSAAVRPGSPAGREPGL